MPAISARPWWGTAGSWPITAKTYLCWKARGLRHEPTYYLPGHRLVTFDVKGRRSGVMICYDGGFPETARSYAHPGCEMLFWLNNRGGGHEKVRPLALQKSMIIAASCCSGRNEAGDLCRGGSNITGETGALMAELWDSEGVIIADVWPERGPSLREVNPWCCGQRRDLYC
ncbi:MAG: carbon-nitrogen hydrolase family protein [Armatimonadetes bacterium]|nr:carbon-nitrogen hydrolase family protein [Armatimonadota bacterium]